MSDHEWFAQACSWQKSDGSNWLFFMSKSLFRSQKKQRIDWKPDEQIPNPGSLSISFIFYYIKEKVGAK